MKKLELNEQSQLAPITKDVYRRLRTNIEFTGVENRVICVTSCYEGDGKSTVSMRLAQSIAENDKSVLWIDADMRNSEFAGRYHMQSNLNGLSDLLSGQKKLEDVLYTTDIPGLSILPTGMFPVNPTELLSKPAFSNLLKEVKLTYDYIIIDTPPLGLVVDAAIIAKVSDGSILTISPNTVRRKAAQNIKEQLKKANPNLLGIVLNKAEVKKNAEYGYNNLYGYSAGGKKER